METGGCELLRVGQNITQLKNPRYVCRAALVPDCKYLLDIQKHQKIQNPAILAGSKKGVFFSSNLIYNAAV